MINYYIDQYSSNQSITLLDSLIYPIVINWLQLDRSVLLIDYHTSRACIHDANSDFIISLLEIRFYENDT